MRNSYKILAIGTEVKVWNYFEDTGVDERIILK
jgi:hypothetical protein